MILSSISAATPLSGMTIYSATKAFDTYISEGLHHEVKDKMDVMSYQPGFVDTNMCIYGNEWRDPFSWLSPDQAAKYCFRDLGYQ